MKRLLIVLAILILGGCALARERVEERVAQQNASINEDNKKIALIMADSRLDPIRNKTYLTDSKQVALAMLSNHQIVTAEEKLAIEFWVEKNAEAAEINYQSFKKWDGQNVVNLARSFDTNELLLISRLYNETLTWSQFNTERAKADEMFSANLQAVRYANNLSLYQSMLDDDTRRSNAMLIFGQGLQNYGDARYGPAATQNQLNAIPQRQMPIYQAPKQTSCTFYGNRMSCMEY